MAIVPLKLMEYGVYGDLIMIYTKPYSIYLRGDDISENLPYKSKAKAR